MNDNFSTNNGLPGHEDLVQFADSHRVSLEAGDYRIDVRQLAGGTSFQEEWQAGRNFSVLGERFQLDPAAIQSVFPPEGSQGDFWHVLPHVVLERSTLPWERSAVRGNGDAQNNPPWLALLVFHPDDPPLTTLTSTVQLLGFSVSKGEKPDDQVTVIDVERNLLYNLIPTENELSQLSHVRRRLALLGENAAVPAETTEQFIAEIARLRGAGFQAFSAPSLHLMDGAEQSNLPADVKKAWILRDLSGDTAYEIMQTKSGIYRFFYVAHEAATVVANRLPKPGGQNVIHLVSVEGNYTAAGFDMGSRDTVRLVSLKKWTFFCEAEEKTFKGLLMNLNKTEGPEASANWGLSVPTGSTEATTFLRAGFVPLRHRFREGSRSISWYHGPLVPAEPDARLLASVLDGDADMAPDVRCADQLVVYNTAKGMFDVSYAAAWELGRLLTLRNTNFAFDLYTWKKRHAHSLRSTRHLIDYGYHLPVATKQRNAAPETTNEAQIQAWFDELSLLYHIPFNYLLPDPRLLPVESIRFFSVDRQWIACLRDGAFSIGRVLDIDRHHERLLDTPAANATPMSGFLLRSELVPGWPKLQITAYDHVPVENEKAKTPDTSNPAVLTPLRMQRLSKNVLFALFPGEIQAVDFFLSPETLHFGLDLPADTIDSEHPEKLIKRKRDLNTGVELAETFTLDTSRHFRNASRRILIMDEISKDLVKPTTPHSGSLALQLVAGSELIRLKR